MTELNVTVSLNAGFRKRELYLKDHLNIRKLQKEIQHCRLSKCTKYQT